MPKLRITVVRTFTPEDVFGHKVLRENGEPISACDYKVGEEFLVDHHLNRPEGFCGRAWHDMYQTISTYFWGGDYEYPEPGITYQPCGDGVRPVVFKIEKLSE